MNIDYYDKNVILFPGIIPLIHKSLTYDTLNDDIIKVYYKIINNPIYEDEYSYINNNLIEDCNSITNIFNKNETCEIVKLKKASDKEKKYFLEKIKLPVYKKYFNNIKSSLKDSKFIRLKKYRNLFYNYFIIVDYEKNLFIKPYDNTINLSQEIYNNDEIIKPVIKGFTKRERENCEYFTLFNKFIMNNI